jgi:hypothetical protein
MPNARVSRSARRIDPQAARIGADRAADAAAAPVRPAVAEPAPMLVAALPARLLNSRHVVPAPGAPLDHVNGRWWIV